MAGFHCTVPVGAQGGAPSVSDLLSRCISGLTAPTPRALDTALALAPSLTGAGGTVDAASSLQQLGGAGLGGAQPAAAPTAATAAIEQLVRELDSLLPSCDIVPAAGGYFVVRRRVPAALQHGLGSLPTHPLATQQQPGNSSGGFDARAASHAGGEAAGGAAGRQAAAIHQAGQQAPAAADQRHDAAGQQGWTADLEQRYQEQLQHLRLVVELRGLLQYRLLMAHKQLLEWEAARAPPPPPAAAPQALAPPPAAAPAAAPPPLLPQAAARLPALLAQASCPPPPSPPSAGVGQALGAGLGDVLGGYVKGTVRAGRKLALTWNPAHSRHKALELLS